MINIQRGVNDIDTLYKQMCTYCHIGKCAERQARAQKLAHREKQVRATWNNLPLCDNTYDATVAL